MKPLIMKLSPFSPFLGPNIQFTTVFKHPQSVFVPHMKRGSIIVSFILVLKTIHTDFIASGVKGTYSAVLDCVNSGIAGSNPPRCMGISARVVLDCRSRDGLSHGPNKVHSFKNSESKQATGYNP